MDRKRVLEALEVLRGELAGSDQVSEDARAALNKVANDVDRLVDPDQPSGEDPSATASGLHDALQEFGAEHPQLAGAINQVAAALANLGI